MAALASRNPLEGEESAGLTSALVLKPPLSTESVVECGGAEEEIPLGIPEVRRKACPVSA